MKLYLCLIWPIVNGLRWTKALEEFLQKVPLPLHYKTHTKIKIIYIIVLKFNLATC